MAHSAVLYICRATAEPPPNVAGHRVKPHPLDGPAAHVVSLTLRNIGGCCFYIADSCVPDFGHEEHIVTYSQIRNSCNFTLLSICLCA